MCIFDNFCRKVFIFLSSVRTGTGAAASKHVVILRLIQSAFLLFNHFHKNVQKSFWLKLPNWTLSAFFQIPTAICNCPPLPSLTKIDWYWGVKVWGGAHASRQSCMAWSCSATSVLCPMTLFWYVLLKRSCVFCAHQEHFFDSPLSQVSQNIQCFAFVFLSNHPWSGIGRCLWAIFSGQWTKVELRKLHFFCPIWIWKIKCRWQL